MAHDIEAVAEQVFVALADPTRRTILAALAQPQRNAQKIGQPDAHRTGAPGIDGSERADRIQAVKKKVWIHLGLQRLQLSFAGEKFGPP